MQDIEPFTDPLSRRRVKVKALCRAIDKGPLDAEEEQYLVDLASLDDGRAVLKR